MPLTITSTVAAMSQVNDKSADRLRKFFTVTGPASYTTGGTAFTPEELGFGQFVQVIGGNIARTAGDGGLSCRIVALNNATTTAPKLQWYDLAGAEIANGIDLSTFSGTFEFIGK